MKLNELNSFIYIFQQSLHLLFPFLKESIVYISKEECRMDIKEVYDGVKA